MADRSRPTVALTCGLITDRLRVVEMITGRLPVTFEHETHIYAVTAKPDVYNASESVNPRRLQIRVGESVLFDADFRILVAEYIRPHGPTKLDLEIDVLKGDTLSFDLVDEAGRPAERALFGHYEVNLYTRERR